MKATIWVSPFRTDFFKAAPSTLGAETFLARGAAMAFLVEGSFVTFNLTFLAAAGLDLATLAMGAGLVLRASLMEVDSSFFFRGMGSLFENRMQAFYLLWFTLFWQERGRKYCLFSLSKGFKGVNSTKKLGKDMFSLMEWIYLNLLKNHFLSFR
jgi:hypothetical protein